MASIRPPETVNKALLSTTSSFIGEYESDGYLLTHAWPSFAEPAAFVRRNEGPASRSAFVFVFETPPIRRATGVRLPDYSGTPELLSWYLSVLFGKRFDNHGLIQSIGHFNLPNLEHFNILCRHTLPHNSHKPRVDYPIPLNLNEITRIQALISESRLPENFLRIFQTSTKFYCQALQALERDAEVAYLHLVTAIEILSSSIDFTHADLLDANTQNYLGLIETEVKNGERVAKHFRSKLLSIRRRFIGTMLNLVDDEFFTRSECLETFGRLKRESFAKACAAAYDLRSQYLHTGAPFGPWVALNVAGHNTEIQVGRPVVANKQYANAIANAPTFVGLERIVRYCLLRVAERQNAYVEPRGQL